MKFISWKGMTGLKMPNLIKWYCEIKSAMVVSKDIVRQLGGEQLQCKVIRKLLIATKKEKQM